ncbi:MAG: SGNH/GDSL hydrolase family protein [Planctomycetota bacterium]
MKSLLARLALAATATVACLLLAEIVVRTLALDTRITPVFQENYRLSANPALRYELVPGSRDGDGVINQAGLREDRDYHERKPGGVFRIACVGDSICYGFGVDQADCFPQQLERLLAALAPGRCEVLNFGVPAYNAGQIVEIATQKALRYDPDLLIYAYCLNDPQEYSLQFEGLLAQLTPAEQHLTGRRLARSLLDDSRLLRLGLYAWRRVWYDDPRPDTEPEFWSDDPQAVSMQAGQHAQYYRALHRTPATWDPTGAALDALADLSATHGVAVLTAVFPVCVELVDHPLRDVHEWLQQECTRRGFAVLDLHAPFLAFARVEDPEPCCDQLHPSAPGHRFTAVAMLRRLIDLGLVPPDCSPEGLHRLAANDATLQRYLRTLAKLQ